MKTKYDQKEFESNVGTAVMAGLALLFAGILVLVMIGLLPVMMWVAPELSTFFLISIIVGLFYLYTKN